ncbi:MAG: NAD-dependent epimerase/dehydratase family protein [Deltaproteobacteria bacterium]|nr:NAD-dependent epimerase/dehydratase family protein [Deltaproteobacteria bacterium]
MKILILGVNGFIGHHLTKRILDETDWVVYGMDLSDDRLGKNLQNPRFHFIEGDIAINREWIEYHVKKCDVVLPLVAIATPKLYVEDPIGVYNLDFEMNLNVIKHCVKYHKRVVFPSTSEVYGACADPEFKEDESYLVVGPIQKERWIPFNWVGPRLDSLNTAKEGSSRVVTQFIAELLMKRPISLVDGGSQKRCFTYVDDGIAALLRILENCNDVCKNQIINIGNPDNECSVRELAHMLKKLFMEHPSHRCDGTYSEIIEVPAKTYYGEGYQDIYTRKPSIEKARTLLGWSPVIGLGDSLRMTLYSFLEENEPLVRSEE